jgi:phenylacetic acid degradation operon negative regulatory protein
MKKSATNREHLEPKKTQVFSSPTQNSSASAEQELSVSGGIAARQFLTPDANSLNGNGRHFLVAPKFRIWTIIVAAFGDVVEPRGGLISLGNLSEIFGALGVDGAVLRTVLGRLVSDGCLIRHRQGRKSFYELTGWALGQTREIAQRVYRLAPPAWDGTWRLIVLPSGSRQEALEADQALRQLGFGTLQKGIFVAPLSEVNRHAEKESGGLGFVATLGDPDRAKEMVSAAWDLNHLEGLYASFLQKWAPIERDIGQLDTLSELEALALRILLIYEFRRPVLQDPCLPPSLLEKEWSGLEARRVAGAIWHALAKPSERWLSKYGEALNGPLPSANADFLRRFLF